MHLVALPNSNCITFSQSALFFGRPSDTEASQTEESFDPCEHVDFATKSPTSETKEEEHPSCIRSAWDQSIFFWLHWQAGIQQCKAQVSQQQYLSKQLFERYLRDIVQLFEGHLRAIWEFSKIYIWELFERYLRASWKLFKKLIESYLQDTWEPFESF